jgi:diacylglycerol kinase family enzyme
MKTYSGETTMILSANGPFIGGSRIPLTDLSPQDGELNTFIFNEQSFSILNVVSPEYVLSSIVN